jgi:hypothetical protein
MIPPDQCRLCAPSVAGHPARLAARVRAAASVRCRDLSNVEPGDPAVAIP